MDVCVPFIICKWKGHKRFNKTQLHTKTNDNVSGLTVMLLPRIPTEFNALSNAKVKSINVN